MVYYLSHFDELTAQRWIMLTGLAIGVAGLMLSPGAWDRALDETNLSTSIIVIHGLKGFIHHTIQYLLILRISYVALFLMLRSRRFPMLWGSAMVALALFCLVVQSTERIYFGLEICALIVVVQLLGVGRIKKTVSSALALLSIITMLLALPFTAKSYYRYRFIDRQIRQTSKPDVVIFADDNTCVFAPFHDRFVIETFDNIHFSAEKPFFSRYYSKESIYVFSTKLGEDIASGKIGKKFCLHSPYPYYIREWDGTDVVEGKIFYTPSPYATYPILNNLARFTCTEKDIADISEVITMQGRRYLVIAKDMPIADRIRAIEVRSAIR